MLIKKSIKQARGFVKCNYNVCHEAEFKNRIKSQLQRSTGEGAFFLGGSAALRYLGAKLQDCSNGLNRDRVTNRLLLEDPSHGVCPELQLWSIERHIRYFTLHKDPFRERSLSLIKARKAN